MLTFTILLLGVARCPGLPEYQALPPVTEVRARKAGKSVEPSSLGAQLPAAGRSARSVGRIALVTAHASRVLKITHPYVSDSGRWEATWTGGGSAMADSEDELLATVAAHLGLP
jgi:hypothetical protein